MDNLRALAILAADRPVDNLQGLGLLLVDMVDVLPVLGLLAADRPVRALLALVDM